jgi:hypothetical protein
MGRVTLDINTLIEQTRSAYARVQKVFCPALGVDVIFNARGFHHLLYKPDDTPRTVQERSYKLSLFPLAMPVLRSATTISEVRDVEVRDGRKQHSLLKKAKVYAFTAKVGKKRPISFRIIVLKIGNGNPMFWSIMKE